MSKTLEELEFYKIKGDKDTKEFIFVIPGTMIYIYYNSYQVTDEDGYLHYISAELHKAIELKMIELGLWRNE